MSATPEQIAERLDGVMRAIASDGYGSDCVAPMVAAAALIRAQAEREKVLVELLEKIAGEAPAKEPSASPTVAWPPNWSDDLRDAVNEMIIDAYNEGFVRALWESGQTADAALAGAR